MYKSLVLIGAFLFSAVAVQAAPTTQDSGSWCYNPKNEPYWGAATASCCNGNLGDDRRCHNISDCRAFYRCCMIKWNSGNHESDKCY
ncbi:hypothetical protein BCR41DRAFT_351805 [Lobosporangium transversale]|uniref:Uncharacterized protein n=1 Tax=Lobosporangium transversale TaxID=64571 RepID=A0A1Y2GQS4_9FUNG|nr:hypothetical protein BCR41DRAFT_351805 [Lobosporangium transversale]ORZ19245.1 hypothetical protein BCR41DRAFT_351805 [Lobosporangium transversale]|eukprot:XP_021882413.1 hypothetical protein BCR41DRAFT_351805 [Lobosporangium transversale]